MRHGFTALTLLLLLTACDNHPPARTPNMKDDIPSGPQWFPVDGPRQTEPGVAGTTPTAPPEPTPTPASVPDPGPAPAAGQTADGTASACGRLVEEHRPGPPVVRAEVEAIALLLGPMPAEGEPGIAVRAGEAVIPSVITELDEAAVLRVGVEGRLPECRSEPAPVVEAVAVEPAELVARAGGGINASGLAQDTLSATVRGGGWIALAGQLGTLSVDAAEGGRVDAERLTAQRTTVHLDSGASTLVGPSEVIDGTVTGGSTLTVIGRPDVTGLTVEPRSRLLYIVQ